MSKRRTTTDAIEIIRRRFSAGHPDRIAKLGEAIADAEIGRHIYELRTKARLTQRRLAKMIDTTASVIARLEEGDFEGNSLAMLNRIATALNKRMVIQIVPLNPKRKTA
jgi:predicted transcriptional regulator